MGFGSLRMPAGACWDLPNAKTRWLPDAG